MPFGCSVSCKQWEIFATFLEFYVWKESGSKHLLHYLDYFLGGGKSGPMDCHYLMHTFQQCMKHSNVPLSEEKTAGPATIICFLGLEIDSDKWKSVYPSESSKKLCSELTIFCTEKRLRYAKCRV